MIKEINMIKKIYNEYLEAKNEKKSSYNKLGLFSLFLSLIVLFIWIILTITTKLINNSFLQSILLIVYFLTSFILNPIFLILGIILLILQWQITCNKFTIFALISNILLLISIIVAILLF